MVNHHLHLHVSYCLLSLTVDRKTGSLRAGSHGSFYSMWNKSFQELARRLVMASREEAFHTLFLCEKRFCNDIELEITKF